jgi:hypothetical protein
LDAPEDKPWSNGTGRAPTLSDFDDVVGRASQVYGGPPTRLGVRLYFLAVLGRTGRHQFQPQVLQRWIDRADRLLSRAENTAGVADALARAAKRGYVCPYILTTDLLSRRPMARKEIIAATYL